MRVTLVSTKSTINRDGFLTIDNPSRAKNSEPNDPSIHLFCPQIAQVLKIKTPGKTIKEGSSDDLINKHTGNTDDIEETCNRLGADQYRAARNLCHVDGHWLIEILEAYVCDPAVSERYLTVNMMNLQSHQ